MSPAVTVHCTYMYVKTCRQPFDLQRRESLPYLLTLQSFERLFCICISIQCAQNNIHIYLSVYLSIIFVIILLQKSYIFSIEIEIEKYFIHPPVGEIKISQLAQKIINIYNDCILDK